MGSAGSTIPALPEMVGRTSLTQVRGTCEKKHAQGAHKAHPHGASHWSERRGQNMGPHPVEPDLDDQEQLNMSAQRGERRPISRGMREQTGAPPATCKTAARDRTIPNQPGERGANQWRQFGSPGIAPLKDTFLARDRAIRFVQLYCTIVRTWADEAGATT